MKTSIIKNITMVQDMTTTKTTIIIEVENTKKEASWEIYLTLAKYTNK